MKNAYSVYIGRFQPFHLGHLNIIQKVFTYHNPDPKEMLILIGSAASQPGDRRNPFSYTDRRDLIRSVLGNEINIAPLADVYHDSTWLEFVKDIFKVTFKCEMSKDNMQFVGGSLEDFYECQSPYKINVLSDRFSDRYPRSGTKIREELFSSNCSELGLAQHGMIPGTFNNLKTMRNKCLEKKS